MFSSLTKKLHDGLEAVENSVAAVASSPTSSSSQSASADTGTHPERASVPTPQHTHSTSGEHQSSSSLAEGALSSIRRSLTLQRATGGPPTSNDPLSRSKSPPPSNSRELSPVTKRAGSTGSSGRLEERLRASLNRGSPGPSRSTTPNPEPQATSGSPIETHPAIPLTQPTIHQKATPSTILRIDPTDIPLPPSPQFVPAAPSSPSPESPASDPLTPNLKAFDAPKLPPSHARSPSKSVLKSPPSLHAAVVSPLLPSFLPSAAVMPGDTVSHLTNSDVSNADPVRPTEPEISPASEQFEDRDVTDEPLADSLQLADDLSLPPPSVSPIPESELGPSDSGHEKLSDRLSLVQQRFSEPLNHTDMSGAFKRLQSERTAAENVLREHTPLQTLADTEALRAYLVSIAAAATKAADDIKQLTAQLRQQEGRVQELRDIHHLEGASRTQQADRLRAERDEAEALLKAAQGESAASALEITRLQSELEKVQKVAKEEEEKRVKAISLLKNVRMKSVKSEKDLEELAKERNASKEQLQREKEASKAKDDEMERLRKDHATQVAKVRAQGEAERDALRVKLEREAAGKQSSYDAETANLKRAHDEETLSLSSHVTQLDGALNAVTDDRDGLFDQLQLRQAELESTHSHLESLENRVNELNHLLRESNDRAATVADELADAQRGIVDASSLSSTPLGQRDAAALQATAEVERKYENKVADLRARMATLERERTESEEEWSRNLAQRSREVERLRGELAARDGLQSAQIDESARANAEKESLENRFQSVKNEKLALARELALVKASLEQVKETATEARAEHGTMAHKFNALESQLAELRSREGQLRSANKTLRDELKKVQSSAALLERQRNPGVGYWAQANQSRSNVSRVDSPIAENGQANGSSRPASPTQSIFSENGGSRNKDEEVNLEYLRNIILQFLEHKEMRADLVRVMSVILRFTPAETRRLVSKV